MRHFNAKIELIIYPKMESRSTQFCHSTAPTECGCGFSGPRGLEKTPPTASQRVLSCHERIEHASFRKGGRGAKYMKRWGRMGGNGTQQQNHTFYGEFSAFQQINLSLSICYFFEAGCFSSNIFLKSEI